MVGGVKREGKGRGYYTRVARGVYNNNERRDDEEEEEEER